MIELVRFAEFENVLVVLGGGWNHYNWPQLFEMPETRALTLKNTKGYYRVRNLFYVAISRPMTRLAVLATQKMSDTALVTATRLFREENVVELALPWSDRMRPLLRSADKHENLKIVRRENLNTIQLNNLKIA